MKNIHVLPIKYLKGKIYRNKKGFLSFGNLEYRKNTYAIYITPNEEIKEGDWVLNTNTNSIAKYTGHGSMDWWVKIILTTDQDLIKDGVQVIDDDFLEWFVKNPSCEEVELTTYHVKGDISGKLHYKIIIPKEEAKQENDYTALLQPVGTKQETLEEVAERYYEDEVSINAFVNGAKWQQEQDKKMYSDEYLAEAFEAGKKLGEDNACMAENYRREDFKEWFEKFKNK